MEVLLLILSILKFVFFAILWIVAFVLFLVVLVFLIVMYTPINHKIIFRYIKEKNYLYLRTNVNLIFKLFTFDLIYKNKKLDIKYKIIKKEKEDSTNEQKTKKFSKKDSKKKRNFGPSSKVKKNKTVHTKQENQKYNSEVSREKKSEETSKTSKETKTERKQEGVHRGQSNENVKDCKSNCENNKDNDGSSKKSQHNTKTIGERFQDVFEKLQEIEYAIWLFTDPKIISKLKKALVGIFSIFKLNLTVFYGVYGTSDYEKLGKILACFYMVKGTYNLENFTFFGDFEKEVLDLTFYTKGKIKLKNIVYPIISLAFTVGVVELKRRKITFKTIFKSIFTIKKKKQNNES